MEIAENESRTYERELKFQLEEKGRREQEEKEIYMWNSVVEKQKEDWKKHSQERMLVGNVFN